MTNVLSISAAGDKEREKGEQGVETDMLKTVIRQHWQSKIEGQEKLAAKRMMADIEAHATNMHKILDTFDYDVLCIPNIIAHSKGMSRTDLRQYMGVMESLATGYANVLDTELTNLLMVGVTNKAKNVSSATRYFELLSKDLSGKVARYDERIGVQSKRKEALSQRLSRMEGSIFRFLMGRRILVLRKKVSVRHARIGRLQAKKQKYNDLMERMARTVETTAPPKPPQPPRQ